MSDRTGCEVVTGEVRSLKYCQIDELTGGLLRASPFRPVQQRQRQDEAYKLRDDKARRVERTDAGKRVAQRTRDRYCGIGKRGRGGEPVGTGDVSANGKRRYRFAVRAATPNHRQQTKGRDRLG